MFIPATALTYPVYNLVNRLHLYDTRSALILIYSCSGIAVSFFVIKNYYDNIPRELEEAARIDGASDGQIVLKIVMPLAKPSIITTALQVLIYVWNEYIYATTFLTGESKYTLAAGLNALQATEMTGSWPVFAAAAVTVSLPVLVIFFLCQKYMTSGLTAGGVKG